MQHSVHCPIRTHLFRGWRELLSVDGFSQINAKQETPVPFLACMFKMKCTRQRQLLLVNTLGTICWQLGTLLVKQPAGLCSMT